MPDFRWFTPRRWSTAAPYLTEETLDRRGDAAIKSPKVSFLGAHPIDFYSKTLVQSYYAIIYRLHPGLVCGSFSQAPTVLPPLENPSLATATHGQSRHEQGRLHRGPPDRRRAPHRPRGPMPNVLARARLTRRTFWRFRNDS